MTRNLKLAQRDGFGLRVIAHIVLFVMAVVAIIPFWLLVASSLSEEIQSMRYGYSLLPRGFSLEAYRFMLANWWQIGRAYAVTFTVTGIGTFISIFITSMMAYGLCQRDVKGVKIVFFLMLITMLFNGGVVPTYYIYTHVLGVRNTIWGLILPNLLTSGFVVILAKNYIQNNIPEEMIQAAEIDGAGQFSIFFKFVLPLSTPILATLGLMRAVLYWNDWINGLYFITDVNLFSIQQFLNSMNENIMFMAQNAQQFGPVDLRAFPSTTARMAIAVVAILPIMILYPFFQKFFAKGITLGAMKG